MPDINHLWGQDLGASASGDLATVDGTALGEQRVYRRLLTNPGAYIWHPDYGAGLPAKIGSLLDIRALKALILSQIYLEPVVSRSPAPVITVVQADVSTVSIVIAYIDAITGEQASLSFDLNG
jgi:hypothetical protein